MSKIFSNYYLTLQIQFLLQKAEISTVSLIALKLAQ